MGARVPPQQNPPQPTPLSQAFWEWQAGIERGTQAVAAGANQYYSAQTEYQRMLSQQGMVSQQMLNALQNYRQTQQNLSGVTGLGGGLSGIGNLVAAYGVATANPVAVIGGSLSSLAGLVMGGVSNYVGQQAGVTLQQQQNLSMARGFYSSVGLATGRSLSGLESQYIQPYASDPLLSSIAPQIGQFHAQYSGGAYGSSLSNLDRMINESKSRDFPMGNPAVYEPRRAALDMMARGYASMVGQDPVSRLGSGTPVKSADIKKEIIDFETKNQKTRFRGEYDKDVIFEKEYETLVASKDGIGYTVDGKRHDIPFDKLSGVMQSSISKQYGQQFASRTDLLENIVAGGLPAFDVFDKGGLIDPKDRPEAIKLAQSIGIAPSMARSQGIEATLKMYGGDKEGALAGFAQSYATQKSILGKMEQSAIDPATGQPRPDAFASTEAIERQRLIVHQQGADKAGKELMYQGIPAIGYAGAAERARGRFEFSPNEGTYGESFMADRQRLMGDINQQRRTLSRADELMMSPDQKAQLQEQLNKNLQDLALSIAGASRAFAEIGTSIQRTATSISVADIAISQGRGEGGIGVARKYSRGIADIQATMVGVDNQMQAELQAGRAIGQSDEQTMRGERYRALVGQRNELGIQQSSMEMERTRTPVSTSLRAEESGLAYSSAILSQTPGAYGNIKNTQRSLLNNLERQAQEITQQRDEARRGAGGSLSKEEEFSYQQRLQEVGMKQSETHNQLMHGWQSRLTSTMINAPGSFAFAAPLISMKAAVGAGVRSPLMGAGEDDLPFYLRQQMSNSMAGSTGTREGFNVSGLTGIGNMGAIGLTGGSSGGRDPRPDATNRLLMDIRDLLRGGKGGGAGRAEYIEYLGKSGASGYSNNMGTQAPAVRK